MEKNVLGLDLKIDQEYIGKCIEEVVKAGMIEALDMKNQFASECVKNILRQRVDKEGRPSTSSWDKDTLLDYYLRKVISDTAKEEIIAIMEESKPRIRELIKKELSRKGTIDNFVNSFFVNVTDTLTNSWKTKIDIKFEEDKETY